MGEIKGFLSYSAKKTDGTNLPSWLHFNPLNRRFSGTAVTGTTAVRVTARDQWGKTVTDDFNITHQLTGR